MPKIIRIDKEGALIWSRSAKGASFCQDDRISPVVRSRPCRTSGNHACIGAKPIFNARAVIIREVGRGCVIS